MIKRRGPIRSKAFVLFAGDETPHRSCGIALAEAFGRGTLAYQALRRGGITGQGTCGAVLAGRLVLGELLGDPEPTGAVTEALRRATFGYEQRIQEELDHGQSVDLTCNSMTAPHGEFSGSARRTFCRSVVAQVAQLVDELLDAEGVRVEPVPVRLADGSSFRPGIDPSREPPIRAESAGGDSADGVG